MIAWRLPAGVGLALLVAYVATLAPGVTYWDSGEFLAAIKSLGIPHPPGTPLFILIGNVWAKILGPVVGFAYAVNLLSAVCTAAACAIFAYLMHRWTGDAWASGAGGLLAGLMSSVWLNANETEVYGPALLVSALLVLAADNARMRGEGKWLVLFAYLCGLGWALQLSALVAVPGALVLLIGARRDMSWSQVSIGALGVAALGASAVLFMLVRAPHDPGVNQGNPETWQAFVDVIQRTQYQPVSMLPRQAPWYIQVGNLFEYADWQVALGLTPGAPPSWTRTPITAAYCGLGVAGWLWHRAVHRFSCRAMTVLFVGATLGVIAYLNMKAGPSYGHGFLPPGAKHEARERDYFFALACVGWGIWAGAGAVRVFVRAGARGRYAGLGIAALPFLLNYPAVNRSAAPDATAARDSAIRILSPAPARAVVFAYGDNDTYPVWYAQHVEGFREDVTVVTIPLLGAEWYRAELERRHGLLGPSEVSTWRGAEATAGAICGAARDLGRPITVAQVRDRVSIPEACL
ncbi:MAG: glycosyltransferase family 117 protein [Gemmatimonadaceae bacterium]